MQSYVSQTLDARNINECENRCVNERSFECRAFAFSYNSRGNSGSSFRQNRNCELSDRNLRDDGGSYGSSAFGTSPGGGLNNDLSAARVCVYKT